MAVFALRDCRAWVGAYDLSARVRSINAQIEVDELDVTTFGAGGARSRIAGLRSASLELEGFTDYALDYAGGFASLDAILHTTAGVADTVLTVGQTQATAGEPVLFGRAVETAYSHGSAVGDPEPFNVSFLLSGGPLGGVILEPGTTARTATGNGTTVTYVDVPSGRSLYAALHVLAVSGTSPSLTVSLQSDDNAGMSSPTTRASFSAATTIGAQYLTPVAGPLGGSSEDYWRASWTISGTSPSFTFVVVMAVA